jgi:hypothetical protein
MTNRPDPFVPPDVDLRDFSFMPLEVGRLRDSGLAAHQEPAECWFAVLLWCASWHQIPAASLPNDDKELAKFAGFGRFVKQWMKVKDGALRGWVECSDGRLYHRVLAEKANESWGSKLEHGHKRMADRTRKANKSRAAAKLSPIEIPDFFQWKAGGMLDPAPTESPTLSDGIPPENALKGREGKLREGILTTSVPKGTGAKAPVQPVDEIFANGLPLLTAAGVSEKNARSMLGLMRKQHGDEPVVDVIRRCASERPLEPVAWLQAALKAPRGTSKSKPSLEERNRAAVANWVPPMEATDVAP